MIDLGDCLYNDISHRSLMSAQYHIFAAISTSAADPVWYCIRERTALVDMLRSQIWGDIYQYIKERHHGA